LARYLVAGNRRVGEDRHVFAEQDARLIANAEACQRAAFRGDAGRCDPRGRHMAHTLDAWSPMSTAGISGSAELALIDAPVLTMMSAPRSLADGVAGAKAARDCTGGPGPWEGGHRP
jgi:hypothetical protein